MNVLTVFSAMAPFIKGRPLHELFPNHFIENMPYYRVKPYCCIHCGRLMSRDEMFPQDRLTPRAICPECWYALTFNITENCWVCGDFLENWKVDAQKSQPHDLHFRIHEGKCCDYFSLISAKALGQETGIRDERYIPEYDQNMPSHIRQPRMGNLQKAFVNGKKEKIAFQERKALPPPAELLRFESQNRRISDSVPAWAPRTSYKGKKVKVIPKKLW